MKFLAPARQLVRSVASVLIAALLFQASPLPVLAAQTSDVSRPAPASARDLAQVVSQLKSDLQLLQHSGKEAFLDALFERLDADEAKAIAFVQSGVHRIGARKICMAILAIGSPVLASVLAVVPESWQEKLVVAALTRFVHKGLGEVKTLVAKLSADTLARGLEAVLTLLGDPAGAAHALAGEGQTWWEKFFSNSTVVRNFIVTIVALSSIGVAVGLAIAGSTAAPVVAVVGALVALIALIVPGHDEHGLALVD